MSSTTNNSLINIEDIQTEHLINGNHSVYKQLFTTWYEPLCRYAYSMLRNMDEAEDIVQKMFCKLWDQRKELSIKTSVKSYLYRAVHNSCLNKIKQTKIRTEHNKNYAYQKSEITVNTANNIKYSELEQKVAKALQVLPPKCREVFELNRIKQKSYNEIALELQISVNTVENHIAKALKLLRSNLREFLVLLIIFALLK